VPHLRPLPGGRTAADWLTGPEGQGLPAPLTSFVGRDQDLADVLELLNRARLITLTGAGGAGKTRLAVEVARSAAGLFADGVWLANLAGIATPALVVSRVMEALGVRQGSDHTAVAALHYRLQQAEVLLVLDNCEHVLAACADLVDELLHRAPHLKVLATSREPLGVPGEVAYPVAPLGLPTSTDGEAAAQTAAVRLFLERGAAANASAAPGRAPVSVVARICRNLDGLPLAIELAAARMRSLTSEEIEQHLADKFRFLRYRRYSSMITSLHAQTLYELGRLDEALRMADETAQLAHRDDVEPQARYRAVRAKILAQRHRVRDAAPLSDEAVARARQTSKSALLAEMLLAKPEVSRLAGATAEATACLSEALKIYQQRGAVPLGDRVRATLANRQGPIRARPRFRIF
jgi:predicted ATPase